MKDRIEILASGFGGQGVVRLGQILGEAAVKQGLHVTMLKSHGTEQRGGYVRAQVVISKDTIDSPMCEEPHYFIALSKAAYDRFHKLVPDYGVILYDPAFVDKIAKNLSCRQLAIPAKDISVEKFGRPIFANTIMLGALTRKIHYLDKEIVLESILDVIPRFHDENKNAFQLGYDYLAD